MTLPKKMKGLFFPSKGVAVLEDEEVPRAQPGWVICESTYTGLTNGTARNVLMGGNYNGGFPARMGYQNVGKVVEVGEGVEGLKVGDVIFSGDFRLHRQWFDASAAADCLWVKIPADVDQSHAALFGVASVAMHDVRRAGVKLGQRVLVVGAGPIGQFTAQAARAAGALVTVIDLNAERLEIARKLGAHRTVQVTADGSWDEVVAEGRFDVVFEDSGAPVLDRIIQQAVVFRGTVVLIAGRFNVEYHFNSAQGAEVAMVHAGHFDRDDLRQVCRLVGEGVIQVGPILREVVPADQIVNVFDRLRDDPQSLFGVAFDWTKMPKG